MHQQESSGWKGTQWSPGGSAVPITSPWCATKSELYIQYRYNKFEIIKCNKILLNFSKLLAKQWLAVGWQLASLAFDMLFTCNFTENILQYWYGGIVISATISQQKSCAFSPGPPASLHSPKACLWGQLETLICEWVSGNCCLSQLHMALRWTADWFRVVDWFTLPSPHDCWDGLQQTTSQEHRNGYR